MRYSGVGRPYPLIASNDHDLTRRDKRDEVGVRRSGRQTSRPGQEEAGKAVDAVLDTIQETLSRGSDVTFSGFGKFHVAERGARQGVHPRTGEPIQIAASKVPRFTAGSGSRSPSTTKR